MKTIECPKCGAASNNLVSCEYCGTLFIPQNNADAATSESGPFVFPKVRKAFEEYAAKVPTHDDFEMVITLVDDPDVAVQVFPFKFLSGTVPLIRGDQHPEAILIHLMIPPGSEAQKRLRQSDYWGNFTDCDTASWDEDIKMASETLLYNIGRDLEAAPYEVTRLIMAITNATRASVLTLAVSEGSENADTEEVEESSSRNSCFSADTLIMTSAGSVPICGLSKGAIVLSRDSSGSTLASVRRVVKHPPAKQIRIAFSECESILKVTPNHLLRDSEGKWRRASRLLPGDRLVTNSGRLKTIVAVSEEPCATSVYNVYLEKGCIYFAEGFETCSYSIFPRTRVFLRAILTSIAGLGFGVREPVRAAVGHPLRPMRHTR